jgi:hypothetical protein
MNTGRVRKVPDGKELNIVKGQMNTLVGFPTKVYAIN